MEEFGVELSIVELVTHITYDYPSFTLEMDCYLAKLNGQKLTLNDHHQIQWIDLSTPTKNIDWVPADVEVYENLQTFMTKSSYKS